MRAYPHAWSQVLDFVAQSKKTIESLNYSIANAYYLSAQESEARLLWNPGQPELHSEILLQKVMEGAQGREKVEKEPDLRIKLIPPPFQDWVVFILGWFGVCLFKAGILCKTWQSWNSPSWPQTRDLIACASRVLGLSQDLFCLYGCFSVLICHVPAVPREARRHQLPWN